MPPRVGPCQPWINGTDVAAIPRVAAQIDRVTSGRVQGVTMDPEVIAALCADAAACSSEILYMRSGRVFTGIAGPVTARPVSRPIDVDTRSWMGGGGGWNAGWGNASYFGFGAGAVVSHFGTSHVPEVELGDYPIDSVLEVKIDGIVIPAAEYELRDYKMLVRLRTSASENPTARWGWPTSQIGDLPDTELGTFSVTYTYGTDAGASGKRAARALAEFLILPDFGDPTAFPQRVSSISRQGISATVASVEDMMSKGLLGIPDVDYWLDTVNPGKRRRQSAVWSPDLGRQRRAANPTPTGD